MMVTELLDQPRGKACEACGVGRVQNTDLQQTMVISVGGFDAMLGAGPLRLGEPDEHGDRRLLLTETGLARHRQLCKQQRATSAVVDR
ncbi:MAG: hypothetical protein ACRDRG_21580 [Pseudonocardiaceae bacterium]